MQRCAVTHTDPEWVMSHILMELMLVGHLGQGGIWGEKVSFNKSQRISGFQAESEGVPVCGAEGGSRGGMAVALTDSSSIPCRPPPPQQKVVPQGPPPPQQKCLPQGQYFPSRPAPLPPK